MSKKQAKQLLKLLAELRDHIASGYENDADTINIEQVQQLIYDTFNL